jgi:hypothetical protein
MISSGKESVPGLNFIIFLIIFFYISEYSNTVDVIRYRVYFVTFFFRKKGILQILFSSGNEGVPPDTGFLPMP